MYCLWECKLLHGEGYGTPLQYSCLENPMDGGAWKAAVHGVTECRMQLSDFTFTFHFHGLEKEMATHSSVIAWRIPGMGEPGGLPVLWRFLKKKTSNKTTSDPKIPLLGMNTEEIIIEKDTWTPMFMAALFTTARTWKQPRCPLTDEWIKNLWYIYTME